LYDLHSKYGYWGLVAWVSLKRGEDPLEEVQTKEEYKEAYQFLKESNGT
jgi:hypothetical protein